MMIQVLIQEKRVPSDFSYLYPERYLRVQAWRWRRAGPYYWVYMRSHFPSLLPILRAKCLGQMAVNMLVPYSTLKWLKISDAHGLGFSGLYQTVSHALMSMRSLDYLTIELDFMAYHEADKWETKPTSQSSAQKQNAVANLRILRVEVNLPGDGCKFVDDECQLTYQKKVKWFFELLWSFQDLYPKTMDFRLDLPHELLVTRYVPPNGHVDHNPLGGGWRSVHSSLKHLQNPFGLIMEEDLRRSVTQLEVYHSFKTGINEVCLFQSIIWKQIKTES